MRSKITSGPSFWVYPLGTRKLVNEQMGQWIRPIDSQYERAQNGDAPDTSHHFLPFLSHLSPPQ
jgi:hypothetical protein